MHEIFTIKTTELNLVSHLFRNIDQYFLRHFKVTWKNFRPRLSIFIETGNEGVNVIDAEANLSKWSNQKQLLGMFHK